MARPSLELPILRRELRGLLRARRALWLLVLAVGVSSLVPLALWPVGPDPAGARAGSSSAVAAFFLAQLAAALAITPAFASGAVAGERERGTWDMILAAPVSPLSLLLSKALASAGYVLIILLAAAPASGAVQLLGGALFTTVLKCYAVTFAAVILATMACLAESLWWDRTVQATVRGMGMVLLWCGGAGPFAAVAIVELLRRLGGNFGRAVYSRRRMRGRLRYLLTVLLSLAALLIPFYLLGQLFNLTRTPRVSSWLWFWCSPAGVIYQQVMDAAPGSLWRDYIEFAGVAVLGYAAHLFQCVLTGVPEPGQARQYAAFPGDRVLQHQRRVALSRVARAVVTRGERGGSLFGNPVLLKDLRTELHGKEWFFRTTFWYTLLLLFPFAPMLPASSGPESLSRFLLFDMVLCALLIPAVAATAIPREAEQGTLDLLRGTRLAAREILFGKLLASVHACAGILSAAVVVLGISLLFSSALAAGSGLAWALAFLAAVAFTAAASLLASVLCRHTLPALVLAYVLALTPFAVMVLSGPRVTSESSAGHTSAFCAAGAIVSWLLSCWWFERFRLRDR